jgi:membrane associated rhomboid family serine protease
MIPVKDTLRTDGFPPVTVALIVANIVVYLLAALHGGSIISGPDAHEVAKYGAIPHALTHTGTRTPGSIPAWETVLTSMFLHASIAHLAPNMLFLWIFGCTVEVTLGRMRFLLLYVLGGVASLALEVVISPNSLAPTVGASGAIAAVLGGYVLLYPRARTLWFSMVPLFFTVVELPVLVLVALWVAVQVVFAAVGLTHPNGGSSGVAYFAFLGGLAFGLLAIRPLAGSRALVAVS